MPYRALFHATFLGGIRCRSYNLGILLPLNLFVRMGGLSSGSSSAPVEEP